MESANKTPEYNIPVRFNDIFSDMPKKGKFLDIGCGDGSWGKFVLNNTNLDVMNVAIDSPEEWNSSHGPNHQYFQKDSDREFVFQKMNAMDLKFDDNMFDVVTCCEILEHVTNPQKVIDEAVRVTKPNGCVYFTTPIGYNYDCDEHLQHFELIDIIRLFRDYDNGNEIRHTRNFPNEGMSMFLVKVIKW